MAGRVDYPGRGPTWIGVPGLVVLVIGVLIFGQTLYHRGESRDLLDHGVETGAASVRLTVYSGKASPLVEDVTVTFSTIDGRSNTAVLKIKEDDPQGMPEGEQAPATGTRYAMPLKILYDPEDPAFAIASIDAHEWATDRKDLTLGAGLLAGGGLLVILAAVLLTVGARRRGLAWNRWYSDAVSS
ncbi:DUF3592 domain-containing protein [Kribbella ginsengisoli]|uniref:DUF3592 domain-containing protein n=1 Tax=Kribbella ginsengisoli TaxID=363865 RepID=A0ABP6YST5_9ACTN